MLQFQHLYLISCSDLLLTSHCVKYTYMGFWQQIGEYFYLRKKDPNRPNTQFVKYMHGINRLSILLFLVALIILVIKLIRKH